MRKKKPLTEVSRIEFYALKNSGMLWEVYPESSGDFEVDVYCAHR